MPLDLTTWLLSDHLGSTSVTADATGRGLCIPERSERENLLSSLYYTAFGEIRTGSSFTDYQYTGQRNEEETGLYYYVARYYDPQLGRFISADTIIPEPGSSQAYDRYAYVNGNPINNNDPSGHCPLCITAAVGAVIGFVVDLSIQTIPQLTNGTAITNLDINWAEAAGATTAGAISGLTLGAGAAIVGTSASVSTIAGMSVAGGLGNVAGNQAGAIVQASVDSNSSPLSKKTIENASEKYGLGNFNQIGYDFLLGAVAGGVTQGAKIASIRSNVPKEIISEPKLTFQGTVLQSKIIPLRNKLGNTIMKPNFNSPIPQISFYTGITTFSNYGEAYFTTLLGRRRSYLEQ